jgi:dolichyl-phosphate-mannose-protein mannosyltransferase
MWNPVGFPSIYVDEGHYMRRALQVLQGSGQQESPDSFNEYHSYDHPYFGQILLGFLLGLFNYPNSLSSSEGNESTIGELYLVPRLLVGALAVLDTFLVYKIAHWRYNRNVALIASILFAVMPMTWLTRRILLDSIVLPLLLSSILFAVYQNISIRRNGSSMAEMSVVLLSGIMLGLALFTKAPAVAFIPVVGYLIISSVQSKDRNSKLKILGIWFIPVFLIPALWPAYALTYGQFEDWLEGIQWQTHRISRPLFDPPESIMDIDPVLVIIGSAGIVYSAIRRDFFCLIWIIPYLLFLYLISYSQYIHLVLLLPIFSVAAAILIENLANKIAKFIASKRNLIATNRNQRKHATRESGGQQELTNYLDRGELTEERKIILDGGLKSQGVTETQTSSLSSKVLIVSVSAIVIYGLAITTFLISFNVNDSFFRSYAALVEYLPHGPNNHSDDNKVTLIGARSWIIQYLWIPQYVFDKKVVALDYPLERPKSTEKVIFIEENKPNREEGEKGDIIFNSFTIGKRIITEDSNIPRTFDLRKYPFTNMKYNVIPFAEIKTNY